MPNGPIPKRLLCGKYRFIDASKVRGGADDYAALQELMKSFESAEHDGYDLRGMNAYIAVFFRPPEEK